MNKGVHYEDLAVDFLRGAGLQLLERNFNCKAGEIDIICSDGEQLVFVEVRYRGTGSYGSAAASVDHRKQHKIIRAAQLYLQHRPKYQDRPCRFDVVAITTLQAADNIDVQWLRSAFTS